MPVYNKLIKLINNYLNTYDIIHCSVVNKIQYINIYYYNILM